MMIKKYPKLAEFMLTFRGTNSADDLRAYKKFVKAFEELQRNAHVDSSAHEKLVSMGFTYETAPINRRKQSETILRRYYKLPDPVPYYAFFQKLPA